MVKNNGRVAWIDATRIFAMLTVVLAHSIGASHMPNQTELIWWIVAWNMPLFIMLSGFTSWRSLSKISSLTGLYQHAIKLSKRMLVPAAVIGNAMNVFGRIGKREYVQCAIVVGLLALIAFLYYSYRNKLNTHYIDVIAFIAIVEETVMSHAWFLSMLFYSMMLFALLQYLTNKYNFPKACRNVLFSLIIVFWGGYIERFEIGDMSLFVLFGVILGESNNKGKGIFQKKGLTLMFLIVGIVLSIVINKYIYFYDYSERVLWLSGLWYIYFLRICCGFCWCIFWMSIMNRIVKTYNIFCYWGTLTIGIYLIHGYFLRYISRFYSHVNYGSMSSVLGLLIGLLPAFIIATISVSLVYIIKRNRTTRELLLGDYNK